MSSSLFSDTSCALCARHRTPPDLNLHVSSSKTCADVYLELSLIDASQNEQKCLSGQSSYRSICCQRQRQSFLSTEFKVTVGVIAGVILMAFATKRVFSVKIEGEKKSPADYKKMKDIPSKMKKSRSKQRSTKRKKSTEATKATNANNGGNKAVVAGEEEDEDGSMLAMWNGNNS
ncbi:unnamed protein product [Cylindrotheca closterium]|uniref:Uncharacterized protein n=1 Tax=Cylindrotheca closterium TaxID=2856 RepID=A0AAD2PVI8_9STRA|nr:unnamed protein product [Cylindrotheca closterium]